MRRLFNFSTIILLALLAVFDSPASSSAQASVPALPQAANAPSALTANGQVYLELAYTAQFQLVWYDIGSGAVDNGAFWKPVVPDGYYALGHYGQSNWSAPFGGMYTARELVPGALAPPASYQGLWGDWGSGGTFDGSFWLPIPQEGYVCLGTVAQLGYNPPSTDAIRCVRQDLVSEATVGKPLWNDIGSGADYDFSSWYIDPGPDGIGVGAFAGIGMYAKPTYPVYVIKSSMVKKTVPAESLELVYVEDYNLEWYDKGSGADVDVAFWNPVNPDGYYALGHYAQNNWSAPLGPSFAVRELVPGALAQPLDYNLVWTDAGSGADLNGSVWKPIPPFGYVCLGMVAQLGYGKPGLDEIRCVREDLAIPGKINGMTWHTIGSPVDYPLGVWRVVPALDEAIYTGGFTAYDPIIELVSPPSTFGYFPPPDILFALNARAVAPATSLTAGEVDGLIQQYGPYVYLHPEEAFFMDDPVWVLDNNMTLHWALVPFESDVDLFVEQFPGEMPTTAATLMDDTNYILNNIKPSEPYNGSVFFKIWLESPTPLLFGDQTRAKAYIRVVPWNTYFTEIQFWFFYSFNGPGRVEVCASGEACEYIQFDQVGRHYGDWENVSLVFLNSTKKLVSVYLSAHSFGWWIDDDYFGTGLAFNGDHPIVFSAKFSHANYSSPGYHDYQRVFEKSYGVGTASGDLYDLTGAGYLFRTYLQGNYQLISSVTYPVKEPAWAQFPGRWGKYEYLHNDVDFLGIYITDFSEIGAGPTGPNKKTAWGISNYGELVGWPANSLSVDWHFIYLPQVIR